MDRIKPFLRTSALLPSVKVFALVLGFFGAQFLCTSIPKRNAQTGVAGGTPSPRQGSVLQKLPGVNDRLVTSNCPIAVENRPRLTRD